MSLQGRLLCFWWNRGIIELEEKQHPTPSGAGAQSHFMARPDFTHQACGAHPGPVATGQNMCHPQTLEEEEGKEEGGGAPTGVKRRTT